MSPKFQSLIGAIALCGLLGACNSNLSGPQDSARSATTTPIALASGSGGSVTSGLDSTLVPGGGGGGGGGGGSVVYAPCGTMTTNIQAVNIVVYTTRIGIGFSGQATNCSPKLREAFDIAMIDQETNPACVVNVPHFIAPKNVAPLETIFWAANSTLVPCQNRMHYFNVTLTDTKTGTVLATATAQAFL